MPKSYATDNDTLKFWLIPGSVITQPTSVHMALFTTTPGAGGVGGVEVSGGSYARVDVSTTFGTPVSGSSASVSDVTFPAATANWGTVNGFGVYNAAVAGDLLYYASLGTPRTVLSGDVAKFLTSSLTASETLPREAPLQAKREEAQEDSLPGLSSWVPLQGVTPFGRGASGYGRTRP